MIRHTIITCLLLLAAGMAAGQKYPERRDIRSGNKFYGKAEYSEAEISYRKALEKQPDSSKRTSTWPTRCTNRNVTTKRPD